MSTLTDAFRNVLMQHLAAGGNAEEIHPSLAAVANTPGAPPASPPPSSLDDMARKQAGKIVTAYVGGAPRPPIIEQYAPSPPQGGPPAAAPLGAPGVTLASALPGAEPGATPAPMAPPLGAPAAPGMPSAGGSIAGSIHGMFGEDPGYNAAAAGDLAAARGHESGMLKSADAQGAAFKTEGDAKAQEMLVRGQMAEGETPIRQLQEQDAQRHADAIQKLTEEGQVRLESQMARYQAASTEAAQAQVHSFFEDKTTGASIMAIISQALSGAANGLSGNPGAPTPLDRIIQRDMDMQKINLEQKGRNADRQGNMLGVLRDELGSMTLAENAYYQASLIKTGAMIAQLAPSYAGGIASAQAQQIQAQVQEKIASTKQAAMASASALDNARGEKLAGLGEARTAAMATSFAAMAKAANKGGKDFPARGFHGVLPPGARTAYDKIQTNAYAIQDALRVYSDILKGGVSLGNYNRLKAADANLTFVMHNADFTRPAQLEGMMDKLRPGDKSAATNWLDAANTLHQTQKDFAGGYRANMLGLNTYNADTNPDGLIVDYNESVMGPLWREQDDDRHRSDEGK